MPGLEKKIVSIVLFLFYFHRFASKQLVVPKSVKFVKKLGIGSPSQSTFRFFIWGSVKSAG